MGNMIVLLLSLLACALATAAGRESLRVARLAGASQGKGGVAMAALVSSVLSSSFAAWLGTAVGSAMDDGASAVFTAASLGVAALQVALLRSGPAPREPTRSVGATIFALLATQLTDAARFAVLGIAAISSAAVPAGAGGATGSFLAVAVAAYAGREWENRLPVSALRIAGAAILAFVALIIGFTAINSQV